MSVTVTYEDLIARCDERVLQDLCSDTNTPIEDLSTDDRIVSSLQSGGGRVEAACRVASIYTIDQLEELELESSPGVYVNANALALYKDIVCQLALVKLLRRRPEKYADDAITEMKAEAEEYLDRLRKGERLFSIEDAPHPGAGLPTIDGPTAITYQRLNMIPDRTKNFYPARKSRLPIGR